MAVSQKVQELAQSFDQLSSEERHDFVHLVAARDDSELSPEWQAEIERRSEDLRSGRVQGIDGQDFLKRLQAV